MTRNGEAGQEEGIHPSQTGPLKLWQLVISRKREGQRISQEPWNHRAANHSRSDLCQTWEEKGFLVLDEKAFLCDINRFYLYVNLNWLFLFESITSFLPLFLNLHDTVSTWGSGWPQTCTPHIGPLRAGVSPPCCSRQFSMQFPGNLRTYTSLLVTVFKEYFSDSQGFWVL